MAATATKEVSKQAYPLSDHVFGNQAPAGQQATRFTAMQSQLAGRTASANQLLFLPCRELQHYPFRQLPQLNQRIQPPAQTAPQHSLAVWAAGAFWSSCMESAWTMTYSGMHCWNSNSKDIRYRAMMHLTLKCASRDVQGAVLGRRSHPPAQQQAHKQ
jgi:hypothetical protein